MSSNQRSQGRDSRPKTASQLKVYTIEPAHSFGASLLEILADFACIVAGRLGGDAGSLLLGEGFGELDALAGLNFNVPLERLVAVGLECDLVGARA